MKLPEQFIEEISRFETIFCLVSGGWHSTTAALLLKDNGFENVILLHNNTYLEINSSIQTINKIIKITNYPLFCIHPDLKGETVWDILKRSFQKIPEVKEDIESDRINRKKKGYKRKYNRGKFECCNKLKKNPSKMVYPFLGNPNEFVIISSLCPYESRFRMKWLWQLRQKETYLRLHKKSGGFWHGYPFRDSFSEKEFLPYLRSKGFGDIKHSGCVICPILIVFKIYNERYYYSSKAMVRAGLPCFEKTMMDFINNKEM